MHRHSPTTSVVLTAALGLLVAPLLAQPMKPAVSTDIPLNPYKLPPFPVEVLHVKAQPGGGVIFTSYMPVAGRVLPQSETPKPKGAEFPSNAAYFSTQSYDTNGQLTAQQGEVFGRQKAEAPNSDFAVFGTIPTDGPQRLRTRPDPSAET
ncbi:hypothetical protein [Spirosoma sordidisoli]|uniref:Uncharacterized protein n=1 Tax=Spirosoma sordidisoli TaxID=2502893 RepID=A0A4V1RVW8_9BACT|nr:hypothetical protein [Spirosoma sordidisoli]RYC68218.1 hypothetical protein EQG79_22485 [Spirosoma sordidisoli]